MIFSFDLLVSVLHSVFCLQTAPDNMLSRLHQEFLQNNY
ncbi:unnamed protein product [Tenebrio molitor]|nr:unnamed protein product [Tenebrio molitor]